MYSQCCHFARAHPSFMRQIIILQPCSSLADVRRLPEMSDGRSWLAAIGTVLHDATQSLFEMSGKPGACNYHLCTRAHPSPRSFPSASNIRILNPSPCFHTHAHYFPYPSLPMSKEVSIKLHKEYWNLKAFSHVAVGKLVSKCLKCERCEQQISFLSQ